MFRSVATANAVIFNPVRGASTTVFCTISVAFAKAFVVIKVWGWVVAILEVDVADAAACGWVPLGVALRTVSWVTVANAGTLVITPGWSWAAFNTCACNAFTPASFRVEVWEFVRAVVTGQLAFTLALIRVEMRFALFVTRSSIGWVEITVAIAFSWVPIWFVGWAGAVLFNVAVASALTWIPVWEITVARVSVVFGDTLALAINVVPVRCRVTAFFLRFVRADT